MTVFIQPPFWAVDSGRSRRHARSVLLTVAQGGIALVEPLTIAQGKIVSGLDWVVDTDRDELMTGWIAAARAKVEHDTGLAVIPQTRDLYFDELSGSVIDLPPQSTPLTSITSIKTTDTNGVVNTLATSQYQADLVGGRIALSETGSWPTDLAAFRPWVIRIVCGYAAADLPKPLLHAVRLMTAHYATYGRDVLTVGTIVAETPYGYEDAIAPYIIPSVA